jgi:Rieske Fe-S protein
MQTNRKSEHQINRRDFLKLGGAAIGVLATARLTSAIAAEPAWVPVGSETDFGLDQPVSVAGGKAFVVRRAAGLSALSALCTHRSCKVTAEGSEFVCPCHMARFGLGGEVLQGPARESLAAIPIKVDAGQVLVQI